METTAPPAATHVTDESGTHALAVPGRPGRPARRAPHPIHSSARRRSN
jgi:hypothetical protein